MTLKVTMKVEREPVLGRAKGNTMCRNPESEKKSASVFRGNPRGCSRVNVEQGHGLGLERKARVSWTKVRR